jgi:hypothetical protein
MGWLPLFSSPNSLVLKGSHVYGRGDHEGRPGPSPIFLISAYGTATVAITCCWQLLGFDPSLYVLTKLDMFVDPPVILPK